MGVGIQGAVSAGKSKVVGFFKDEVFILSGSTDGLVPLWIEIGRLGSNTLVCLT